MQIGHCSIIDAATAGYDQISPHLAWLLSWAVRDTGVADGVNLIVCNPDIPPNDWGVYSPTTRSIGLNLWRHFDNVRKAIQEEANEQFSIRALLLRDLMDTINHEAWHAKKCLEGEDFVTGDLDEHGAVKYGYKRAWQTGELYDVEIESFGPYLDHELHELYKEVKEDATYPDCPTWKRLQLHMFENELSFYNPNSGVEIRTIRELMQAVSKPKAPWIETDNKLFHHFAKFVSIKDRLAQEEAVIHTTPSVDVRVTPPVVEKSLPDLPPVDPTPSDGPMIIPEGYDSRFDNQVDQDDCVQTDAPQESCEALGDFNVDPQTTTPPASQEKPSAPLSVAEMGRIGEHVMRCMFNHVFDKCVFDGAGRFKNPSAVLDSVSLGHIPNLDKFITHYNCVDSSGKFRIKQPICNGIITGVFTTDSRPQYQFYFNHGGKQLLRHFTPPDPDAKDEHGELKPWSLKSSHGWKIMSLSPGKGKTSASLMANPEQALGQEMFKTWEPN